MNHQAAKLHVILLLLAFVLLPARLAEAQLSSDIQEIFEEMIPQLEDELSGKLKKAIEQGHDYIELTPEQFKRFRDHPANPFEGWNGIDPDSIQGTIRLQFETQPIRSRKPGTWERQHRDFLSTLEPLVAPIAPSTVRVTDGKKQLALGMIVSSEGHVLTKLSEVANSSKLLCKMHDGRKYSATLLVKNPRNDLALLKIDAGRTTPVVLTDAQPGPGAFVVAASGAPVPMAVGVCSVAPRSLIGKNQAFLGVKPINDPNGVKVVEVTKGSSAELAGIQLGDVLTNVNGRAMKSVADLVNTVRENQPGDKVIVEYLRGGEPGKLTATLKGRNVGGPSSDRFPMMKTFGAVPSKRRSEFPLVFQHDMPLLPEQCGGPLVDLQGNVVGINIARGGRVASYAIPSGHLKTVVGEMMRPQVASSDVD